MYATASDVQTGTYPDLWQKGRYRVELSAELPFDPDNIDTALQQLGYHAIDADQWGQSYSHKHNRNLTAEVDEVEGPTAYVRLVLRNGDLDEADIGHSENQLGSFYDRIYQICRSLCDEYDYEPLHCSMCPDGECYSYVGNCEKEFDL